MTQIIEAAVIKPISTIDHPAHPEWASAAFAIPTEEVEHSFRKRFANSVVDVTGLLGVANCFVAVHRQARESENIQRLMRGTTAEELAESYAILAGDPEKVSDYVSWFSKAALTALKMRKPQDKFSSVALELGTTMQNGDWDRTTELDAMVEDLRDVLPRTGRFRVSTPEKPGRRIGYVFMPLILGDPKSETATSGVIRRRRAVADVVSNGGTTEIFKQSFGLAVFDATDPEIKDQIVKACKASESTVWTDNAVANIVGSEFERAIVERSPEATNGIAPVSAQYVMRVRSPQ
jgi:hypothetical protein